MVHLHGVTVSQMVRIIVGKHDDDKDGSRKNPDPAKWEKPKDNGGGKHEDKNRDQGDDPKK